MASIELKNIGKVYKGGVRAVNDFSMKIEDGEFIIFVGPSGCGKSTTLRMIAGLEDITEGELYIDDEFMNDVEPKDRNLAMVFQNYALYPYLTVYDNIAFGLKLRHVPKDEIDEKVHNVARILDIENLLKRKPGALSGGQRQRVALGRAIVRDAKAYLFDEPLSNLDAKLRGAMRVEITKLFEELKTTFIYVTHDQVEAMTMGTRIVVMKDGFVQQIDTPTNLYDHPANKFVAGFIGTPQMNFFEVDYKQGDVVINNKYNIKLPTSLKKKHDEHYQNELKENEDNLSEVIKLLNEAEENFASIKKRKDKKKASQQIKSYQELKDQLENIIKEYKEIPNGDSHKMILGIRSEDIKVNDKGEGINSRVKVIETLGSECLIYLEFEDAYNDNFLETKNDFVMKIQGRSPYKIGDVVKVNFDVKKLHLFDFYSEKNIDK